MSKRSIKAKLVAVLVIFLMAAPAALAFGQAKKKRKSVRGKGRVSVDNYDSRNRPGGGGATDLGVSEIEGRIFKPAVFFVLARSDFQYEAIEFKQSFVDRILAGALRRPF
jgi:hypothetical protein